MNVLDLKMFELRFSVMPGSHEARWARCYDPTQTRKQNHDLAMRIAKLEHPEAHLFEIRELTPAEVRAEQQGRF